jgi:hypothetical protein
MELSIPEALTLKPLTADEEDMLCGRTVEVNAIVENCRASRLTVVTSSPGLGASSLLRAGAEPALRRDNFITVVHSNWQGRAVAARFRDAVIAAVREQASPDFSPPSGTIQELLTEVQQQTGRAPAILLDQFEDYVRCHSGTDISDLFDAEISHAISTRSGRFVVALQALSVTPFERLSQFVPNLMGFNIRLRPVSREAGGEIVRRVFARAGMDIEGPAVEQLVNAPPAAVGDEDDENAGVHPLFLRLAADRLIALERAKNSTTGRASTISANGGAGRMTLEALDEPLKRLGKARAALFCRWMPLLISRDGDRTPATGKALLGQSGNATLSTAMLPIMVESGLLRTIETRKGVRCEFARESTTVIAHDWHERMEVRIAKWDRLQLILLAIVLGAIAIIIGYEIYRVAPPPTP